MGDEFTTRIVECSSSIISGHDCGVGESDADDCGDVDDDDEEEGGIFLDKNALYDEHDEMMEAFQEAEKHNRPRYFQHKRNHLTTQDV